MVGHLVPTGTGVVPKTLVGTPLADPRPAAAARAAVLERGLAALDGCWWCRLPDPLPRGLVDAARPAREEPTARASLPIPVGALLVRCWSGPSAGARAERSEVRGADGSFC